MCINTFAFIYVNVHELYIFAYAYINVHVTPNMERSAANYFYIFDTYMYKYPYKYIHICTYICTNTHV